MAGCCIVMIMLIVIPLMIVCLAIFLGLLGSAIVTFIVSTVLLIVLTKSGVFDKYCNSDVVWQRILAKLIKAGIIFVMVIAVLMAIAGVMLLVKII